MSAEMRASPDRVVKPGKGMGLVLLLLLLPILLLLLFLVPINCGNCRRGWLLRAAVLGSTPSLWEGREGVHWPMVTSTGSERGWYSSWG